MLVHDEGVAVIAIEAVSGGKPHEAPAILQNGSNIALREAIVGGEMSEFEVPQPSFAALSLENFQVAGGWESGSSLRGPSGSGPSSSRCGYSCQRNADPQVAARGYCECHQSESSQSTASQRYPSGVWAIAKIAREPVPGPSRWCARIGADLQRWVESQSDSPAKQDRHDKDHTLGELSSVRSGHGNTPTSISGPA